MDAIPADARAETPAGDGARRSRVSGIERSLQILDCLQERGRASSAYDIARAVGAPLSTVYAIVEDLVRLRVLSRDSNNAVWLGPRLYHYGLAYARELDLMTIASAEMQALARAVGETVQICGRDGEMMVVQAMAEGPGHFTVTSRIGTRIPLNWTASGRLLVAHLDEAERFALFARTAKPSPTGRAITDPKQLVDQCRKALSEGIYVQEGESDFAVACIASPIRDRASACPITISIVMPEARLERTVKGLVDQVRRAAHEIEHRLGWHVDTRSPRAGAASRERPRHEADCSGASISPLAN